MKFRNDKILSGAYQLATHLNLFQPFLTWDLNSISSTCSLSVCKIETHDKINCHLRHVQTEQSLMSA